MSSAAASHASGIQPPALTGAPARLVYFLIVKSLVEALLVVTLGVHFHLTAINPYFQGAVDEASARRIAGWVIDESSPAARIEVQLYIDDRFVASRTADTPRPDVLAAGLIRDEHHGFSFAVPPLANGEHEARVYALHTSRGGARRVLQQLGPPRRFRVTQSGAVPETGPQQEKQQGR
jgi:hypothetical protein